jgi:hypothetical protein
MLASSFPDTPIVISPEPAMEASTASPFRFSPSILPEPFISRLAVFVVPLICVMLPDPFTAAFKEVAAMLTDLERVEQGGAAFRIVVGRFGSGKSFFLNLVRTLALQKRMVVIQADMSMERRLHATGGEARALYSELTKNLATKSKTDGGALRNLCEGWISGLQHEVTQNGGKDEDVKKRIFEDLKSLQDHVGGFEFAEVIAKYYEGYVAGNDALQSAALRWLRGEYTTKTEAREELVL